MGVLCLASENEVSYIPRNAVVFNPVPAIDAYVRIALAASGFTNATIVRSLGLSVTTSVVTEPPVARDHRVRDLLPVAFDINILRALAPDVNVRVGSLLGIFPSTRWRADGGGQALDCGSAIDPPRDARLDPVNEETVRLSGGHVPDVVTPARDSPRVRVLLGVVPDVFTRGIVRYSRRVQRVDGIELRNGDAVRDADGRTWFFKDGELADRIETTVLARSLRSLDDGAAIGPREAGATAPDTYVPDAKYALNLVWSGSGRADTHVFAAQAFPAAGALGRSWGWYIDPSFATVEHPRAVCQNVHGVALAAATAQACLEAGGTWDRPCETDTECPYYDARRGRGGCDRGGFCEMPLGVDRVSFRQAVPNARIMRLGCSSSHTDFPSCSSSSTDDARFERR